MPDFPQMPETDVAAVESSDYRQEIFDKLLTRWSPARISESLLKRHGVIIKPEDIEAYRQQIPEGMALEGSELAKFVKNIDVRVDALLTSERVIVLLEQRLGVALVHEKVTQSSLAPDSKAKDGDTLVEHRARLLLAECNKFERLLFEIGERRPQMSQEFVEIKEGVQTLREMIEAKEALLLVEGEFKEVEGET